VAALAAALLLAGCGGDDGGARPTGTTAVAGASTTTAPDETATGPVNGTTAADPTTTSADGAVVVTDTTDRLIAAGTDARRGIRLFVETAPDGTGAGDVGSGEARAGFSVTPRTPAAARRRLARTSGFSVRCVLDGAGATGAEIRPAGSRIALPSGTTRRTDAFLRPAPGRTVRDSVRSCALYLSRDPRGSTTRTYESGTPARAYATVRFR
jgi:hypothetical protein